MSGFQNAGVTKGLMIVLGLTTLTASLFDIKPYLHLQLVPHLTKYRQFWRLAVHPLAFANSTELLLGELLLYNVGVGVERAFGPRKYASFILVSTLVSTVLAFLAIILGHAFGLNSIPAGPYGIIFSVLWQQYRIYPSLYHFRVFGVDYSSKAFNWVLAALLLLTKPPSSILIAICGLISGYIYRTDILFPLPSLSISRRRLLARRSLKSYRIPLSVHRLLARIFAPLVGRSRPPRRSQRVLPGQAVGGRSGGTVAAPVVAGLSGGTGLMSESPQGLAPPPGGSAPASPRASLRSMLASRYAAGVAARAAEAGGAGVAGGAPGSTRDAVGPAGQASDRTRSGTPAADDSREPGSTTAAMGEWVSELTGRSGARAPTEDEIGTLSSMFPNLGREDIVRALQRNDNNTAQAVEALLEGSG